MLYIMVIVPKNWISRILHDHQWLTGATACVGMVFTCVVAPNEGVQETLVRGGGFMAVGLGKMNWF